MKLMTAFLFWDELL